MKPNQIRHHARLLSLAVESLQALADAAFGVDQPVLLHALATAAHDLDLRRQQVEAQLIPAAVEPTAIAADLKSAARRLGPEATLSFLVEVFEPSLLLECANEACHGTQDPMDNMYANAEVTL